MRGRGRSQKTIGLIAVAYAILEEIQPASIRAVCYRLFAAGYLPSMEKTNTNRVSRLLARAREEGIIPWEWVVDETREAERVQSWSDLAAFGDTVKRSYRKNYWAMQPKWVEVWSEKGTVRGTLAPVLNEYGITFRVMHGHTSATSVNSIVEDTLRSEKKLTALYVGDWDPSGMHMSELDLPGRLAAYGGDVDLIRVALDEGDTEPEAGVSYFPAADKTKDPRYRWFIANYGNRCFELDALNPNVLRARVQAAIRWRLDPAAWDRAVQVEAAERASMAEVLARWPSISMPANKCSPEGAA